MDRFFINEMGDIARVTMWWDNTYRASKRTAKWRDETIKKLKTEKGMTKFMLEHGWLELPSFVTDQDGNSLYYTLDNHGRVVKYRWLYTLIAERQ